MPKAKLCAICSAKIERPTRAPNAYNLFVKEHMQDPDIQALKPTERLAACAKKWNAQKGQ